MEEFEAVYESMLGERIPGAALPWVVDAFEEGSFCSQAYEEVHQASERLCARLGVANEDADVETIIARLLEIQKELCMRSFLYGRDYDKQAKAMLDETMQKYL